MTCRITQKALAAYRKAAETGRVIVFDTETTGLADWSQVIQIAAVEYVCGIRSRSLCLYIKPTCEIEPGAEAVHHISQEFLDVHGLEPCEALRQFFDFVGEGALLVAHNANFDYRMMAHECRAFAFPKNMDGFSYCDTIALAKRFVPGLPSYKLGRVVSALHLEGENTHDALDDATACGSLFFHLMARVSHNEI